MNTFMLIEFNVSKIKINEHTIFTQLCHKILIQKYAAATIFNFINT